MKLLNEINNLFGQFKKAYKGLSLLRAFHKFYKPGVHAFLLFL